jgi:hypothetical protein
MIAKANARTELRGVEDPELQGKTRNKELLTPVNDPHGGKLSRP